jgi:hypothetical protein
MIAASRIDTAPLFADLALARRIERAEGHANARFVEASARVFPERGACWVEVAGAYAMFDGVGSPVTQTFGLGLFEPATAAALEELERFFRERGAAVCHEVSPLAGVELFGRLLERGYRPIELTSVLVRTLSPAAVLGHADDGLSVRLVVTAEDAELWAATSVGGWQGELPESVGFLHELGRIQAHRTGCASFLAVSRGEPIAAAALTFHDGVATFAGACTVPEARRRGAQNALFAARLRHASDLGCDLAMMGASPGSGSQRNAERNGFRVAYTRVKWQLG